MAKAAWTAVLVGTLVACGGGGGGGSGGGDEGPTGPLAGAWHYVALDRRVAGDAVRSETGQCVFDDGLLDIGTSYAVQEGGAIGPQARQDGTYALAGGRDLTVTFAGRTLEGVASADEKLASAVSLTLGEDPGTMIFVRRDTTPAQADLTGAWVMFAWGRNPAVGGKAIASVAGVNIGAAGAVTLSNYHYNLDGAIDPNPTVFVAEVLEVAPGGWLERRSQTQTEPYMRGGISVDHDIILLGRTGGSFLHAQIVILIRVDADATDALLDGTYGGAGFESAPTDAYTSYGGTIEMNGLGSGSWLDAVNLDGAVASATLPTVYTVHASGRVTFTFPTPVDAWGAVGEGGRFAVWSGFSTPGALPTINFLIR